VEKIKDAMKKILQLSSEIVSELDSEKVKGFIEQLKKAKRVYTAGIGSLGLIIKGFVTKLMYLGYETYFIGETLMPSPSKDDLFIAVSESGETDYTVKATHIAKNLGATIVAITSNSQSTLGKLADLNIEIKWKEQLSKTKEELKEDRGGILTLDSSLFEITTLVFLNTIISELANKDREKGKDQK